MNSIKTANGSTLRIAGVTGSVGIKDGSARDVKAAVNLLLHEGYEISTGAGSAAYISLDGKNVVKLDASGKVAVEKSGSGLKLTLTSGTMYSGLDAKELSHVQTSNMATGVRG